MYSSSLLSSLFLLVSFIQTHPFCLSTLSFTHPSLPSPPSCSPFMPAVIWRTLTLHRGCPGPGWVCGGHGLQCEYSQYTGGWCLSRGRPCQGWGIGVASRRRWH
jgi:hypothetical protein